jgi:proteasome inhibitor subunit 1 (PI31)
MSKYNGLELCYHAFKDQIKRDADLITLFVHWYLVQNGFECVIDGKKTEILPSQWNSDDQIYVIDYTFESKGYELKVLAAEDSLIINLLKKSTDRTANITCIVKDHISNYKNEFQNLYMNLNDLHESMHKEFEPLFKKPTETPAKTATTTTTVNEPPSRHDPLRVDRAPMRQPVSPYNIGRSDLDPFASNSNPLAGGMIFDPLREYRNQQVIPGNLPRGAVPPGARYDPFGPVDPDDLTGSSTRIGPNRGILRPPNFDDNMFM